uniref:UBC core domain-containing protein n=1 Tax=Strongyloides venezuelensis TaxID=75913 RepID=A0A0K0FLN2_STRVS
MAFMYPQNYPECPLLLTEPAWYSDDYPEKEELHQLFEQYKKDRNASLNIVPGTPNADAGNDTDDPTPSSSGPFPTAAIRTDGNDEDEDNDGPPASDEDE